MRETVPVIIMGCECRGEAMQRLYEDIPPFLHRIPSSPHQVGAAWQISTMAIWEKHHEKDSTSTANASLSDEVWIVAILFSGHYFLHIGIWHRHLHTCFVAKWRFSTGGHCKTHTNRAVCPLQSKLVKNMSCVK